MSTLSRRARATVALWGLNVAVLVIASCNRDLNSPEPRNLHPSPVPGRTLTYPHTNNGPCYVWGQDNPTIPPSGPYRIGLVGVSTIDTTCGVPISFLAFERTGAWSDTTYMWYYLQGNADNSIAVATRWFTGPRIIWGGFGGGLGAIKASFAKPLKSVTVRFRCPIVAGFRLAAWMSDGSVLGSQDVPTVPADPNGTYGGCGNPVSYSDVTITVPSIYSVVAYGPPPGALSSAAVNQVGVEYWIVPDSTPHLQLAIDGLHVPTFVRDSLRYTPSVTDGSSFTITNWKWVADAGTTPPPGITETHSVSSCNGKKPANPCIHTPVTSGTVTVYATVKRKSDSASRHLTVTMPRYPVKCGPPYGADSVLHIGPSPGVGPITRGGTVLCNASVYYRPSTLSTWKFKPDDSALDSVVAPGISGVFDWSGTGVTGGTVTVQGTINGIAAISDTARFTVTARSGAGWDWTSNYSTGDASPGTFDCSHVPHYATTLWGWAHADSTCQNQGLLFWPDPTGGSSNRGWIKALVSGGPNNGLWYVTQDRTTLAPRAQVLWDIRSDGDPYVVQAMGGHDTVAVACANAEVGATATVWTVNLACMGHTGTFAFDGFYNFAWRHERCHLLRSAYQFLALYNRRAKVESLVSPDTVALNFEALNGINGFLFGHDSVSEYSRFIDKPNPDLYDFWSQTSTQGGWYLRTLQPGGILSQGC